MSHPNQVDFIERTRCELSATIDAIHNHEYTGAENITEFNLQHYATTKMKIDACFDNIFPSIIASDERIKNGMIELVNRGIKVRLVTEITKENINYCKEIMKISEIRHLEGVKGNFGIIDEREYDMHIVHQESQAPTQMIYCNVKSSVEAQQFLFNTLWEKAIPAEERITEIEEGLRPAFIETFRDADEIQRITILSKGVLEGCR